MVDDETLLVHTRPLVAAVLDVLAPLVADAIEALQVREFDPDASDLAYASGVVGNGHLSRAAELVRSLGGNDRSSDDD